VSGDVGWDPIFCPAALRLLLKMRKALVLVYRWIEELHISEQLFGKFAEWLFEICPRDVRSLHLALQAPGDPVDRSPSSDARRRNRDRERFQAALSAP